MVKKDRKKKAESQDLSPEELALLRPFLEELKKRRRSHTKRSRKNDDDASYWTSSDSSVKSSPATNRRRRGGSLRSHKSARRSSRSLLINDCDNSFSSVEDGPSKAVKNIAKMEEKRSSSSSQRMLTAKTEDASSRDHSGGESLPCAVCGQESFLVCLKCKMTPYCSSDHQMQDWIQHKKTCGQDPPEFQKKAQCYSTNNEYQDRKQQMKTYGQAPPESTKRAQSSTVDHEDQDRKQQMKTYGKEQPENLKMNVGDQCTRCLEILQGDCHGNPILNTCRVPHPEDLQDYIETSYGPHGMRVKLRCGACRRNYERSSSDRNASKSLSPITRGCKWCFEGDHTIEPMKRTDKRRVKNGLVVIRKDADMQAKINNLDGNEEVTILRICSDGLFSNDYSASLKISLPSLIEVQLEDVEMAKIHLTPELTPNVERISMQNPSQSKEPDFIIICPKLKYFSCHHLDGCGDWVRNMLQHATILETFDSYKLWIGHITFASNKLKTIRLHRADNLSRLTVYAPRLTMLNLQSAYSLSTVSFLESHPTLSKSLPKNFHFNQE